MRTIVKAMAMGSVLAGLMFGFCGNASAKDVKPDGFGNSLVWMKPLSQNGNVVTINRDAVNRAQYKPTNGGNNATPMPLPRPR